MRGFHFRLDPLLALRRHKEQTFQLQLAESQRALEEAADRAVALESEIKELSARLAEFQGKGTLDLDRLDLESSYLAILERRLEEQLSLADQLTQRVAQDRESVLQASREKKSLEKLRESLMLAFAREESQKELKGAEEIATSRYVRRHRDQGKD